MHGTYFAPPRPAMQQTTTQSWRDWYLTTEKPTDVKVSRAAFDLASLLLRDRLPGQSQAVKQIKVRILDFGTQENDISIFFECLGAKVEVVKAHEIQYHLLDPFNKLLPTHTVVIANMNVPIPPDSAAIITSFVSEGGRLLVYNSSPSVLAMLFPGKFSSAPFSTTVSAKLHVTADKDLFTGYENKARLNLEITRSPLEVKDRSCRVLAKINALRAEPLLVRFTSGRGVVYIFVSRMFAQPTTDIKDLQAYLISKGGSKETVASWLVLQRIGYKEAFDMAMSSAPSMELALKILVREYTEQEKILTTLQEHQIAQEEAEREMMEQMQNEAQAAQEEQEEASNANQGEGMEM